MLKDCTLPLNIARTAARKMDFYVEKATTKPIAVHHVLVDLCQQLDCTEMDEPEEVV